MTIVSNNLHVIMALLNATVVLFMQYYPRIFNIEREPLKSLIIFFAFLIFCSSIAGGILSISKMRRFQGERVLAVLALIVNATVAFLLSGLLFVLIVGPV